MLLQPQTTTLYVDVNGKRLLVFVGIETVLVFVAGATSMVIKNDVVTQFYIAVLLITLLFMCHHSYVAVSGENIFELAAFLILSVLVLLRCGVEY